MSAYQKFDVIVIGAGVAGLGAAALLAKDHGKKVLVLERAPFIGGRTLSYVGKGNKVTADGVEMDARAFRKSLPYAHCYLGKCDPPIEVIFDKGLLDGRTFEAGGHGLFWGNKGRVDHLMRHLGVSHNLPLNKGLAFVKWNGEGEPTTQYQVAKGKPYAWMSEQGYASTMEHLTGMASSTFEDMAKLMRTPMQSWLEQRGMHPEAYNYIKVLAASQTAQAEPALTPTGDFLGYMSIAGQIRMNLISGSVATADAPGCIAIPQQFEKVVLAHGGEVWRNTPVKEVLIEDGRVTGVRIKGEDNDYETDRIIEADQVICTIPPKYIFKVLPEQVFPKPWVDTLKQKFWGAGLLTGWFGMKRSQFPDAGIEEGSFCYMPGITQPDEGFIGVVDMVMCDFTAWGGGSAKRGPEGKREYLFSTALTDEEMRNPQRVNRVIALCEDWAKRTFPNWERDFEFCIWTPSPEAYGLWRPVGMDRPDVQSPWVKGLYFAGDQYGRRLWGGGVDGASLSAVMCVDKMMGTQFEEQIMPPYHRGIPELDADSDAREWAPPPALPRWSDMPPAFDVGVLAAWLDAHLDGFGGPMQVLQFSGGQSNPTFLLTTLQAEYVLRKQPPGVLLPSAHAIDREYRIMRALAGTGVPVPTTRIYCTDAAVIGTPFYLTDFQSGRIFTDPLLPDMNPGDRAAAYDAMNATLAQIHGVDWHAAGLADYGRPERFIERQLTRWNKQIAANPDRDLGDLEHLGAWLASHVPDHELATITHGDFRIGNLIYASDTPSVAAVLDWELSTIGHPFSDLAFNCMSYHLPAGHPVSPGFVGADLAALGIPDEDTYLAAYAERSGHDVRPDWRFYMAFSLFRTAAIQLGVYNRALQGNASSTTAGQFGDSYRMVAQAGLQLTR